MPTITVLMPAYNHERYVEKAILSVLNQTYTNIHLVVVDDGSSDSTPTICEKLSQAHGFTFLKQENQGLCKTLNYMHSELCKGEWVALCASDDYWLPNKLEKQMEYVANHPDCSFVFSDVLIDNGDDCSPSDTEISFSPETAFADLLEKRFDIPGSTPIYKNECYHYVGGYDRRYISEDWFFQLKVARNFQMGMVDEHLSVYRRHSGSTNMTRRLRIIRDAEAILDEFKDAPNYKFAKKKLHMRAFSSIARRHKAAAVPYIFRCLPSATQAVYWKTLAKLLLVWR